MDLIWLIPILPGLGAALNGLAGIRFFSKTRGMTQRLANGNTLIVEANAGKAFELTPAGELAWEYYTPIAEKGKRHVIIILRRYPESWIEIPAS